MSPQEIAMNASEYKDYHESFMQNNHGTTALHTFFCIFFTVQCTLYCSLKRTSRGLIFYVYDYFVIVLPLIFAHTILSNYIYVLNLVIFTFLILKFITLYSNIGIRQSLTQQNVLVTKNIQTISCLRGLTYLITVLCILAVDFQVFPRNLAKTEKYGFSLMDTGVGLFVLMSGLVHKDLQKHKTSVIIKSNAKFVTVLALLGVARFISIKQLDYQEHVTEYGVHWNFFFTLAVCKLLSTCLLFFTNKIFLFSLITLVFHELLLYIGLRDWVFSDTPRINLITANREGISSCLGYVSLYLYAAYIKSELSDHTKTKMNIVLKLVSLSVCLWIVLCILNNYLPISRTLTNSSYCVYISSVFTTVIFIMYFIELLFQDKTKKVLFDVPLIILAINDNGLIYFLAANLLTGAVNLSLRTLLVSGIVSIVILNFYMILTLSLVVYLRIMGIKT